MSKLFEILDQLKLDGDEERCENVSMNKCIVDSNNENIDSEQQEKKID